MNSPAASTPIVQVIYSQKQLNNDSNGMQSASVQDVVQSHKEDKNESNPMESGGGNIVEEDGVPKSLLTTKTAVAGVSGVNMRRHGYTSDSSEALTGPPPPVPFDGKKRVYKKNARGKMQRVRFEDGMCRQCRS